MSALQTYEYPGWGTFAVANNHYTQAIRVGDRIVCSGQGGWDPQAPIDPVEGPAFPENISVEIDQAFQNVETNLKFAGGEGWGQVYKILTLSTDIPSQHEHIVRNLKKWLPETLATWTEAGVKQLGAPKMRFEVEVEAYDPEGAKKEDAKRAKEGPKA